MGDVLHLSFVQLVLVAQLHLTAELSVNLCCCAPALCIAQHHVRCNVFICSLGAPCDCGAFSWHRKATQKLCFCGVFLLDTCKMMMMMMMIRRILMYVYIRLISFGELF